MRHYAWIGLLVLFSAHARAAGDPAAGEAVFTAQCSACHALDPDEVRNGPTLKGIVGRPSGSIGSFDFSDAMASAELIWDAATLDTYLQNPRAKVPGTKMAYQGLTDATQRLDLIAYLATVH